jgi:predicted phage terminase large subunit-like protein
MKSTINQKAWQAWRSAGKRIASATTLPPLETEKAKSERVKRLLTDFYAFAKYYFPHYAKSEFAWFHKEAVHHIVSNPDVDIILEWPREHAKSVLVEVLLTMFLYFRREVKSMVLISSTQDKANKLLGDIQQEFESNQRLIHDFGDQKALGSWADGEFQTSEGVGFYALGRGQSARGIRDAAERPNLCVWDDIDTNQRVRNEELVDEDVEWLKTDVFGACSIEQCRFIGCGNRIHKKSILAKMVGDIEETDPKKEGLVHIKVYALEDDQHRMADHISGRPAWKERYTTEKLLARFAKLGYSATRREFFHEHILKGKIFKPEHIQWEAVLPWKEYDYVVSYCDPSYKDTKKSDFKAIVLVGIKGTKIYIIDAWVRQASISAMVAWHYEIGQKLFIEDINCQHYIEANFIQDMHLNQYQNHGRTNGWVLPITADHRDKPDKYGRIESLEPLFEQGLIVFNEKHRKSVDMQTLVSQFLSFPTGHDDGPDAVEGAIYKLRRNTLTSNFKLQMGNYTKSQTRSI